MYSVYRNNQSKKSKSYVAVMEIGKLIFLKIVLDQLIAFKFNFYLKN